MSSKNYINKRKSHNLMSLKFCSEIKKSHNLMSLKKLTKYDESSIEINRICGTE